MPSPALEASAAAAALLLAALCHACAAPETALRLDATDRLPFASLAVLRASVPTSTRADMAATVIAQRGRGLVGVKLDQPGDETRPWLEDVVVTQQPLLGGNVVVFGEGTRLTALVAASGERLWSIAAEGSTLRGVADDGEESALLLEDRAGRRSVAVYDRRPALRLRLEAEAGLGLPELEGGALLLPWGGQFLSAFAIASGSELVRVRLDTPVSELLRTPDELYVGGPPFLPLGATSAAYALPRRPLPGRIEAGTARGVRPAADGTRLYVRPGRDGDAYVASYGRLALGFDQGRGALLWVKVLPGKILGGAGVSDGFALCDDTGLVQVLSAADGSLVRQLRLVASTPGVARGLEPTLRACGLGSGRVWLPSAAAERKAPTPLIEQLSAVLALSDPGLSDAQRFLSRELAERPEPEATLALIQLATRRNADHILQTEAQDLLATRRNGTEFMLQALSGSGPFARDPSALPPVAALADALAALDEQRAAPLLAEQLNQPGHSADAILSVATALERLASEREYHELAVFFSLHHTTADHPDRVAAVIAVSRTLLHIGGDSGRALLQFALRNPLTLQDIRSALLQELGPVASNGPQAPAPARPQ